MRGAASHLLLLVGEAGLHDLDHLLEVREHRAPHQDRDLLDDLHPRVPRLRFDSGLVLVYVVYLVIYDSG